MWWYGKVFCLAWRVYPWPSWAPWRPVGYNALETELCWRAVEDETWRKTVEIVEALGSELEALAGEPDQLRKG